MVKIRLMRVGKKKQPSYRVVVSDSRSPRDGRIIEAIGNYQPRLEPSGITIDNERAVYWLGQGAQPSEQVKKLLQLTGAWSAFTGEAAPVAAKAPKATPAEAAAKATPAASVKATPAASTTAADEAEREKEAQPAEPAASSAEESGTGEAAPVEDEE
jgi:small subunit ribosomal protein S16